MLFLPAKRSESRVLNPPIIVRRAAAAVTIGETDACGRFGVTADLRTFAALGVRGAVVQTFVAGSPLDEFYLREQLYALQRGLNFDALKVARIGAAAAIRFVAEQLSESNPPRVTVDASMLDSYGSPRIGDAAVDAWKKHLLPMAELVVVNAIEGERLFGRRVESKRDQLDVVKRLYDLGPTAGLVTGGRLQGLPIDLYFDGTGTIEFGGDRVEGARLPYTGGVLTAAIVALRARGVAMLPALERSRAFVNLSLVGAASHFPHGAAVEPMVEAYRAMDLDDRPVEVEVEVIDEAN